MSVISKLYQTENVTIISFEHAPAKIDFIDKLFGGVKNAGINVDMISQTAPKGEYNTIAFTINDDEVAKVLSVINELKKEYGTIVPMVSAGNVKISLYGEEMPSKVGVASDVFLNLCKENIDIMLITTSDVDISLVVSSANSNKAYEILKSAYIK